MTSYYYQGYPIVTPVIPMSNEPVLEGNTGNLQILRSTTGLSQRWEYKFKIIFDADTRGDGTSSTGNFFVQSVTRKNNIDVMPMIQQWEVDKYSPFRAAGANAGNRDGDMVITITGNITEGDMEAPIRVSPSVGGASFSVPAENINKVAVPVGSFIQFTNHSKVYLVTEDITFNSRTINFWPGLAEATTTSATIRNPYTTIKPQFNFWRSLSNLHGIRYEDSRLIDPGYITIMEAL